jgi:hypothetical protein
MSNEALKWAYSLRLGKTHTHAKAVLAGLADMAGPDGGLWARQDTLSDRFDMPERTLRKWLAFLVAGKVLTVERGQRGNRYVLHVGAAWVAPEAEAKAPADRHTVPINGHQIAATPAGQIGTTCRSDRHTVPIRSAPRAGPSIDEPNSNPTEPRVPPNPPAGGGGGRLFDSFLSLYPRVGDRHATERAWRRQIARGVNPQDIVDGLEISLVDGLIDRRDGGRFAPPAAQWLRGRRWLDFEEAGRRMAAEYAAAASARH